ncbi:alpha/beta fold hydrolase [[Acholeplasma] multilocale]|uniref:alpha/beta fold hydrolase n=1 Tax=[Acholeplasma] multilocale TaxID=264638 RepID=UPI00047B2AEB|nr:alpha/beta hydrolase [[Acholeplasma] multilocale]
MRQFQLQMIDGQELTTFEWTDVKEPIAVIQLVHGSAEKTERYIEFAQRMNKKGIIVVSDEHRGHGRTADLDENGHAIAFFAEHDGWNTIVDDLKVVNNYIKKTWPDLPVFMLGHSMGSFMARTYAIKYSESITGLILSGTAEQPKALMMLSIFIARMAQMFKGAKTPSKFIWNLSYKRLNKKYDSPTANGSEWQSRDEDVQGWFIEDPLCGQVFTTSAFKDMFKGLLFNSKKKNMKLMREDLPILIASGDGDPVGNYGKMPEKVHNKFTSLGYDSELTIYPNLRHEILFEPEKHEVEKDILKFVKENKENHF